MLNRFFGKNFHSNFHLFGISSFAIGLPTSKVILSLATMLILLNLVLEGSYKTYWQNIKTNKLFLILALFWSLHIIGLFWTSDFHYAFNDIRIKLTLLIIPLVLTSKPIQSKKNLLLILGLFTATLVVTSFINFAFFQHWIGNKTYNDIRELSLFGSHIRYGILISVGAGISLLYLWNLKSNYKWIFLPVLIWFSYYTYYSQIISGLIALVVVFFTFLIFLSFKMSRKTGILTSSILLVILLLPIYLFYPEQETKSTLDYKKIDKYTPYGNEYSHYLDESTFVNGKPVFAYVSQKELKIEWEKVSTLDYDGLDKKGQPLRYTLIRYMTSKDLRKDGKDFLKLTKEDIEFIEAGIAGVEETNSGLLARTNGILFQLKHTMDPNGHSLLQRIEYWKTAAHIIQNNWIFGVGTGDVQEAFDKQYKKENSLLLEKNRLRAHNSYLTAWVSFGIIGFIIFLWMNVSFLFFHWKNMNYIPLMFITVAMCTFFIEDTLETQMGVSFFAFFYGLYLSPLKKET